MLKRRKDSPFHEQKHPGIVNQMEQEGLSRQDIEIVVKAQTSGMVLHDPLNTTPRPDYKQFFDRATIPGRNMAAEALTKYQQGDCGPLAQIINNAVQMTVDGAKTSLAGKGVLAQAKLTGELLKLTEQDPALAQAAREKGLTKKDIRIARGMDCIRKLEDDALYAEKELTRAAEKNEALSEVEKKLYMKDIIKFQTASALLEKQAQPDQQPEFAEKTVTSLGYDKLDIQTLALEHLGDKKLKGNKLILTQDKLQKGERVQVEKAPERENQMDIAVDYGHGGPEM